LKLHIEQGNCVMDAADLIRKAGGIEKWLAKHNVDLGVRGKSRTTGTNLVIVARAGYEHCRRALNWAAQNRDRVATNRTSGLDYFIAALRAYGDQDRHPKKPPKRKKKRDREKLLLAKLARREDWVHRLIAELEKACRTGRWSRRVLTAIRSEMDQESVTEATDSQEPVA
jgi:hypothetical protein